MPPNNTDLAVYSSDVLLLSGEYFDKNTSFAGKYCVSKALLMYSVKIIQTLSLSEHICLMIVTCIPGGLIREGGPLFISLSPLKLR